MQLSLMDQLAPGADPGFQGIVRRDLGQGAWVDFAPGWLSGQQRFFDLMLATCDWENHRRTMYDRIVDVPRLVAAAPGSGLDFSWNDGVMVKNAHRASVGEVTEAADALAEIAAILSVRYRKVLSSVTLGYYRDGRDSVAYHGDKMGVLREDTVVAICSVGSRRKFLLRPKGGGQSRSFQFGGGDLLVMGGSCQTTWEHAIPKMAHCGPRIAIMFREEIPLPASRPIDWDALERRAVG